MTVTSQKLSADAHVETQTQLADVFMTYKVGAQQTPGGIAVHEWELGPRKIGAPPHRHEHEDEIFYVLEGEVTVMQDDEVTSAGPGSYVVLPRGRFHTFWNASDKRARMLVVLSPGNLETFFKRASALFREGAPPDMAELGRLMQAYGLTMQFERMPELIARYQLESDVPAPPQ